LLSVRAVVAVCALAAPGFDSRADDFTAARALLSVRGVLAVRGLADVLVSTLLFGETLLLVEALAVMRLDDAPLAATTPRPLKSPGFGVAATGGCP
jgi:hypothetical protein